MGAGTVVVTYLTSRHILGNDKLWLTLLPVYLVAANSSLAYWSPAGLETAAFAFLASLALYLYLLRSRQLVAVILIAVWVRPEGALIAAILILAEAVIERRLPRFTLTCTLMALILSIPFVLFKLYYYGSILPNPFYAKTGFQLEQLSSGLEYAGRFAGHYGFYGVGFLGAILSWRQLSDGAKTILVFAMTYTLYIILVGGDVLKVHRFFLPILGAVAIINAQAVHLLLRRLKLNSTLIVPLGVSAVLILMTFWLPSKFVDRYNRYEELFTRKMRMQAEHMAASDSTNFTVALPTIGVFGYTLLGHEIIDMVGLTDSTIARHSEEPIPGMESTWKESKHNSRYLLRRAPDYIVFSTGIKPSAPAERALLLFPAFMEAYRTVGWHYVPNLANARGTINSAFERVRRIPDRLEPTYPVEYVQNYKLGLDNYAAGDHRKAIEYYDKALRASPKPYYPYLVYQKAFSHMMLNQIEIAEALMDAVLAEDSLVFECQKDLYMLAVLTGKNVKAKIHKKWVQKLVPWLWPRVEKQTADQLRLMRERAIQSGGSK